MNSRPWRTNAHALIDEFADRRGLVPEDIRTLLSFARRLEIDPLDIFAPKDHVGEHHCRIGPSATIAGRGPGLQLPHRRAAPVGRGDLLLSPSGTRPTPLQRVRGPY